jgi:hypothetical protein
MLDIILGKHWCIHGGGLGHANMCPAALQILAMPRGIAAVCALPGTFVVTDACAPE